MIEVELKDYMGSDEAICDAARVSHGKKASNYPPEKNEGLLKYLFKHKHTSPFRHAILKFRIKCPIYVERQIFKYEVGVAKNSISGRYVDFSDTYTEIEEGQWRSAGDVKQGSGDLVEEEGQKFCCAIQDNVIRVCRNAYENMIANGVCKEQARTILPLCLNTEFIWTGSFQAFMHMCDQRLKEDAQKETRDLVQLMLNEVKNIEGQPFKYSLRTWGF